MTRFLLLRNRAGILVDRCSYEGLKDKDRVIQKWKYRYGKKFLELIVEDEKDLSIKNNNK